jgi:2-polyprenyl-3-methyl-5-hydroxy-6-metoxy-1,4-benzoquinol methylase
MTDTVKSAVTAHYDGEAVDYTNKYDKAYLDRSGTYPANYMRLGILNNRLSSINAKRVFEIGMGEGTPLLTWSKMGIDVSGCDLSATMVASTTARLMHEGVKDAVLFVGDAEDAVTLAPALHAGKYDAVVASGVLPHVQNEPAFFNNLKMLLRPGGHMFVEFRNKFFSLFTMNRFTKEFILDDLLEGVSSEIKKLVSDELDRRLATTLPAMRSHSDPDRPSYDQILAKYHNPFELEDAIAKHGFKTTAIHWYHYHAAPPMLADKLGQTFKKESVRLENEGTWRGMFLCSAGVIEAELGA